MYHSEILTFYANIPYVQSILCLVVKIATPNPIDVKKVRYDVINQSFPALFVEWSFKGYNYDGPGFIMDDVIYNRHTAICD